MMFSHVLTYVFADPAAECVEPPVHGAQAEFAARHHHRGYGRPRVFRRVIHLLQNRNHHPHVLSNEMGPGSDIQVFQVIPDPEPDSAPVLGQNQTTEFKNLFFKIIFKCVTLGFQYCFHLILN